jgi:hypothetical protein
MFRNYLVVYTYVTELYDIFAVVDEKGFFKENGLKGALGHVSGKLGSSPALLAE